LRNPVGIYIKKNPEPFPVRGNIKTPWAGFASPWRRYQLSY